jgi:predicted secreted protein
VPVPPQSTLSLRVGETTIVRLPGLGTAGYAWTVAVSPTDGEVVGVSEAGDGDGDAGPPGASREHAFVVTARRAGTAVVHFEQRRPWEQGAEPLESRDVEVVVEP